MPYNRVANIRRRLRQTDLNVKRAMKFLADVMVTVGPQHPELAMLLWKRLLILEHWREQHLHFYREHWSGTERGLWKEGEFATIIGEATPIPADRDLTDSGTKGH